MTHPIQSTDLQDAVQLLADNGFEGMADAIQILFNEAMKIERTRFGVTIHSQAVRLHGGRIDGGLLPVINSVCRVGMQLPHACLIRRPDFSDMLPARKQSAMR